MHEITNTTPSTPITIPTANGRVTILPQQKRTFEPGMLSPSLLKALQGQGSTLKLTNSSEEANSLATEALKRIKRRGFAIVHGAGDITVEEALRREKAARFTRPAPVIRDDFARAQKEQENLGPAPSESDQTPPAAPQPDGGEPEGEGQGEGTQTEIRETPTAQAVIEAAEDMSMRELRTAAKEVLGEEYPHGSLSREDIVNALKRSIQKED